MRYPRGTRQAVILVFKIGKIDRVGRRDTAETGSFTREKNNIASRSFNDLSLVEVNVLRLLAGRPLDGFKIWLKSAWNAKSLPHSSLTLPQLPSNVLFPPSMAKRTRRCVAALEKGEEIAREKRRRREKYKEEKGYAPYVYLEKQED